MSVAAPAGTLLKLIASGVSGQEGTPATIQTLDDEAAETIVTLIGSCATGTGGSDGALLTYSLVVDDVAALVAAANATPTITLTLTDAS